MATPIVDRPSEIFVKFLALLVGILLLCGSGWSQQTYTYPNLDDSYSGWGSCTGSCAGGAQATNYTNTLASSTTTDGTLTPTVSTGNDSMEFWLNGGAYTDVLWWNKVGANNGVSNFTFDFWVQLYNSSAALPTNIQALEFDTFQFIKTSGRGTEYMFGTQCNYASGVWQVWNQQAGTWNSAGITCVFFQPNVWYHITWHFHRTKDKLMHYDSLSIVQYNTSNQPVSTNTYALNIAYPSGPMPSGWTSNMGVQFQMDSNASGGQLQEYVDAVTLTAW